MRTIIELHHITNYAPNNMNRDENGSPKDCIFGGTPRRRMSKQCWMNPVRRAFDNLIRIGELDAEFGAFRTRRVSLELAERLQLLGRDAVEAELKARQALSSVKITAKQAEGSTEWLTETLLFLGERELTALVAAIDTHWDLIQEVAEEVEASEDGSDTPAAPKKVDKKKAKNEKAKKANPAVKKAIETAISSQHKAIGVALFGRCIAGMPGGEVDGAVHASHPLSTHKAETNFDYFTAQDDKEVDGASGAGMIGTTEFGSACMYGTASIDWDTLVTNLSDDTTLALKVVEVFIETLIKARPKGKQHSFAAYNATDFVAITIRHDEGPQNFVNAFDPALKPLPEVSLAYQSVEKLIAKTMQVERVYGNGKSTTFVLDLTGATVPAEFGTVCLNLAQLIANVIATLRG